MNVPREDFVVRRAEKHDMAMVLSMIQELADFEKMSSGPKLSVQDLIRDAGLDGGAEVFHCYIIKKLKLVSSKYVMVPMGYSICYFSFSTWQGKCYFIEDLYIKPEYRNLGAGAMLFEEVVKNANSFGCKRIDFHVLGWNPARKFYEKMGASDLTELEDWHLYRLFEESIKKLSK